MRFYFCFALIALSLFASAQTALQVTADTVKIANAELQVQSASRSVKGFLFNTANGRTVFQKIGNNIQFVVGTPLAPKAGDSIYTNSDFAGQSVKAWRNGLLQYKDASNGIAVDSISGSIVFRPALSNGDRIYIESIRAVQGSDNSGESVFPPVSKALGKLYAGAADMGDNNTYVLRWTTNARSLYLNPRVLGIGSSTLAGYGLTFPDRIGDKVSAWLTGNTTGSMWRNLAVSGYTSANLLPAAEGGIAGTNIDSALNANPDFVFVVLASNDVGAGLSVNQSIRNYRRIDSIAQSRGVPVFFSTTQPRNTYTAAQQTMLKVMADSIRKIWPDRYIEAFRDVVDKDAPTDGIIQSQYDNGDGIHLNGKGNQFIVEHLFDRWIEYFRFSKGVKQFVIDSSADKQNWARLDVITDRDMVKKVYSRANKMALYFRVRAELTDGSFTDYSNIAKLNEVFVPALPPTYDHRILIDLGGDGVNTVAAGNVKAGKPTPSPDSQGKIWNNWYGKGGITGFVDSSYIGGLKTAKGDGTNISMLMLGTPEAGYGNITTKSINYNGFQVGVNDYPMEALFDNVYFYSAVNTNPIVLRIKGLSRTNTYYIKLWGARIDDATTPRTLEVKLGTSDWSASQKVDTRYPSGSTPDYNRAINFNNITGVDSIDLNLKVASGSTFGHLSLIDIGIMGTLPVMPKITIRDTSTISSSIQLTPAITLEGFTMSSYQWTQLAGPNPAVIATPGNPTTTISGLTNGSFTFRLTGNTTSGLVVTGDAKVDVYPDNNGKKTLRVYFSQTKAKPLLGWMNAYGPVTGSFVSYTDNATNWTIDNAGAQASLWSATFNVNAADDLGTVTGNNSGAVPDIALIGYWFNSNLAFAPNRDNLIISGLDPAKTYTLKMIGSRGNQDGATAPRTAAYRVNGGSEIIMDAFRNTTNMATVSNVTADATGKIKIAVYLPTATGSYGNFSYINALILQEN